MKRTAAMITCLMLMFSMGWAQSGMTDSQIVDFVMEQHANGASRQHIVQQLVQRGVTIDQLRRLQKKYEQQVNGDVKGAGKVSAGSLSTASRMRQNNAPLREQQAASEQQQASASLQERGGKQPIQPAYNSNDSDFMAMDAVVASMTGGPAGNQAKTERRIFGHDVFNNKNLSFESSMNLATPQNYRLGPGDVVNVDIWGASQLSVSETISPDGTISIEGVGIIELGGLSVSQAKQKLRNVVGPRYQSSQIELTLGQTRTITVSIMGEVKVPGTYTMSAFATVYNALYMAGGPNDIGTLRNIQVYRNGRLLSRVDVYDFLLNGKLTGDVRLQDNDIITVKPYEALVNISGRVKRPMYYEMKTTESAATLLYYAGGFASDAHTKAVRIHRKAGEQRSVFSVGEFDMSSFKLMDGDSVCIDPNLNRYQNMVEIRGGVFRPGMYQLGDNISTVKALVEAAAGLTEGAIAQHAVMHRMKPDRTQEVVRIDLGGILNGTLPDVPLQNEDVVYIASREEHNAQRTVTINGEVHHPGVYKYADNETIEDFIIQAGGLTEAASLVKVDVARRIKDPLATEAGNQVSQVFSFSLNPDFTIADEPDFTLQPFDEVYVRRSPNYMVQQNITIDGEVQFQGTYALSDTNQRLSDIIKQAGGLTSKAYPEGTKLMRRMTPEERVMMETMLRTAQRNSGKDSIDIRKLMTQTDYPVGIELEKALKNPGSDDDPILREGDHIIVPRYDGTVKINGEVLYPNTVRFKSGMDADYYIDLAGGVTSTAKKSKTIIIYMNGMVARAGRNHKPAPGCQIVVPTKRQRQSLGLQQWLSIGTSAASLGTMAASIANLIK